MPETGAQTRRNIEAVMVSGTDLLSILKAYNGEYVTIEIGTQKYRKREACGGKLHIVYSADKDDNAGWGNQLQTGF